jgi:hypothetical protein
MQAKALKSEPAVEVPPVVDKTPPQAEISDESKVIPPMESATPPVKTEEEEDEEEELAPLDGDDPTAHRKQSARLQKAINKKTREKYEAIRRADAAELREKMAEERAQQLEQYLRSLQPQQSQSPSTPAVQGEPTLEQFGYDQEAFQKAERQWLIGEAKKAARAEIEQELTQRQMQEQGTRFNQRVAELEKKMPGAWQRAIQAPLQTTPIIEQVIFQSDVGPEIGVYLADHLDEAQAITRLPPMQQAVAMGRIEAAVKAAPAAPPRPPKALTAAPAPSAPLPSGSSAAKKKLEDQSIEDRIAAIRQYSANH